MMHRVSLVAQWQRIHLPMQKTWARHGSPLQSSCLENPMDRGAWRAAVPGVTESWT